MKIVQKMFSTLLTRCKKRNWLMMRVIVHFCHTQSSLVRKIEKFSMTLEIAGPYVTHTQPTMQRLKFAFSQQHFLIIWMLQSPSSLAVRGCSNAVPAMVS